MKAKYKHTNLIAKDCRASNPAEEDAGAKESL